MRAAGIPVYWIVNLIVDKRLSLARVEVYTDPDQEGGQYRSRVDLRAYDHVPVVIDGQEVGKVAVGDLLPPALATDL